MWTKLFPIFATPLGLLSSKSNSCGHFGPSDGCTSLMSHRHRLIQQEAQTTKFCNIASDLAHVHTYLYHPAIISQEYLFHSFWTHQHEF